MSKKCSKKLAVERLEILKRHEEVSELRLQRFSAREIAGKLGISHTQVLRDLAAVDAEILGDIKEKSERYKAECLATLQRVIKVGWTTIKVISTKDSGVLEYSAPALSEINDAVGRIAKLLGLNAPEDLNLDSKGPIPILVTYVNRQNRTDNPAPGADAKTA